MAAPCQIRPATPVDVPRLADLERRCFTDPWSPEGLREMVTASHVISLVADVEGTVVGYVMTRWAADTAEILNLAVAPEDRRKGVASRLLDAVLDRLSGRSVREVYLEVRESNRAARALYEGRGFGVAGMRRAYYRCPTEDALVLRLPLDGPA